MTSRSSSESNDDLRSDELRLLDWLEGHDASLTTEGLRSRLPEELRPVYDRWSELISRARQLDELAGPARLAGHFGADNERPSQHSDGATDESGGGWFSGLSATFPRPFGPYDLEAELGRGGMGVVYLARHRTLGTHFALKVIRTSEFASPEEIRRFFQEAQAASRLRHPHVVPVHDAGEVDGTPYLVMQYVPGETLASRMRRGPMNPREAVQLLIPVARAVASLHRNGIIHRDLKPGNLLIDENGGPHVTDFGLAKVFQVDDRRTATGTLLGTPAYMAPEQAWGRPGDISAACDVYSLGAILYELLTGRPPFPESNPLDQILRLRDSDPRPVRAIRRDLPIEVDQICMRCLEKTPAQRYHSADELADDLQRFLQDEPIAMQPIGFWNAFRKWIRREPALVLHLAGLAVMALIVQVADLMSAHQRAAYAPVMMTLAVWTVLAILFQKMMHREVPGVRLVWLAVDAILFTVALSVAEGPIEALVVGYSLLIAASGLWYQQRHVWLMTAVSVLSYVTLLQFRHDQIVPGHYPYIVAGILTVVGGCVSMLVRRIRQLLAAQAVQLSHADNR